MIIGIDVSQMVYKTGVSRYTRELVEHLLKIDKKNTYKLFAGVLKQYPLIFSWFHRLERKHSNLKTYTIPFPPKVADKVWNEWHRFRVEKFIGKVDVFHTSNWTQPPSKASKVATIHDLTPLLYPQHHEDLVIENFKRNLAWIEKECQAVITDSEATRKDVIRHTNLEKDKVTTVPLAASPFFKPEAEEEKITFIKRKYHIKERYILSVATQEPRKNIERVIQAFLALNPAHTQLVLVGKEGWGKDIDNQKDHKIVQTGFVADEDLPTLYTGADMFIYPSLYEGFGLPVLEAMQCGCPVITSKVSSLPEVAGEAGLLVHPENTDEIKRAMEYVLQNETVREKMHKKSLKQAKQFNWDKTAKQTLAIYKKMSS